VAPTYDPARHQIWQSIELKDSADVDRVMQLLKTNPTPPTSRIRDSLRPLPLMLEANWNLEAGHQEREPDYAYDRDSWYFCPHDGFHIGHYAFDEEGMLRALNEALEAGRTVYFEDRRNHPNIRFLHGGPTIVCS